ncbi:hypothetical protein MARPO_0006s0026, partial [Marchantia polymorpha]
MPAIVTALLQVKAWRCLPACRTRTSPAASPCHRPPPVVRPPPGPAALSPGATAARPCRSRTRWSSSGWATPSPPDAARPPSPARTATAARPPMEIDGRSSALVQVYPAGKSVRASAFASFLVPKRKVGLTRLDAIRG